MEPGPSALQDIRIVELSDLAGAYCGKLLADMGAEVIKIEAPSGAPSRCQSPLFDHYNVNKRSLVLDPTSPADRATLRRVILAADALIDAEQGLRGFGLEMDSLGHVFPHLIVASIAPFGSSGPRRDDKGSDLVCQAAAGMVFPNGDPASPPLQGFGLQAYHAASLQAAIGVVLALMARRRDGCGQHIDISIQEAAASFVEHVSSLFFDEGTVVERQGAFHWTRHFRTTRCCDGHAVLSSLGDWTSLIEWVKADGKAKNLAGDEWYSESYRRAHAAQLFDVLDRWAADYSVGDLVGAAQLRRLPFAAVQPVDSLLSNPQLVARHFFARDPQTNEVRPGAPYRLSRTPWILRRRAPRLGEHTQEILAELCAESGKDLQGHGALPARSSVQAGHTGTRSSQPLQGTRVIDFTWVVAGPAATRILADHGADVIKIEPMSAAREKRRGGVFGNLNRGKRSLALNMNDERGRETARRLIASADVVIDNFSARVMQQWGLDYAELRRLRPDVIGVSMTGFGATGPWRDHVSYAPTLQALAGFSWAMRRDGGAPTGWGFSFADMAAGSTAALATVLALWHRARTGEGQQVDLAQFEALACLVGPSFAAAGTAIGNRSQEMPGAPHGVYRCADRSECAPHDRWCAIALFGETEWRQFCHAMGDPAWAGEASFRTAADRVLHRERLDACVESWTRERRAEDVARLLQQYGLAAAVVADARDLCETDEHLRQRNHFMAVATAEGFTTHVDTSPIRLSRTPAAIHSTAPLLGEHTHSILSEILDMTADEIDALREAHIVG